MRGHRKNAGDTTERKRDTHRSVSPGPLGIPHYLRASWELAELPGFRRDGCQMVDARLEAEEEDDLAEAETARIRWAIFNSSTGRYWATRRGEIPDPRQGTSRLGNRR